MNLSLASYITTLKKIFDDKRVGFVILIMVMLARLLQLIYLFNTRADMTHQIWAAQSLFEGHGYSLPVVNSNDLSSINYEPLTKWPPGFSILFLPFYALTGGHYLPAAIIMNFLSALALILFSRGILKILGTPHYLINLFTLLTGFMLYYFQLKPSTDATAIALMTIAIFYAIRLVRDHPSFAVNIAAMSLSLLFCALVKYLYLPLVFLVPLLLLTKGYADKKPGLKKAGGICLGFLAAMIAGFLIYQKWQAGSVGYIKQPERGLYPEHLPSAHPFLPAAFTKPETWMLLPGMVRFQEPVFRSYQFLHLVLYIVLIVTGLRLIKKRTPDWSPVGSFFILGLFLSIGVSLLLGFLSLTVAREFVSEGVYWTYVEEPRYYGLLHVFVHLGMFLLLQIKKLRNRRWIFVLLLALTLPELARGLVFTANRLAKWNSETYGWQYELQFQKFTAAVVKEQEQKHQDVPIVLAGTPDWMVLRAALYCRLPVFHENRLLSVPSSLRTKNPVLLLVIVRLDRLPMFQGFIRSPGTELAGSDGEYNFYTFLKSPG